MIKAEYKVSTLVDMIDSEALQLPEMQRQYVWRQAKVRDLLDSPYRGYPSGIILAWNAPHDSEVETRAFAIAANKDEAANRACRAVRSRRWRGGSRPARQLVDTVKEAAGHLVAVRYPQCATVRVLRGKLR